MSATNRIELCPEGIFSNVCQIVRDDVLLSRTGKLYWPLRTGFQLGSRSWVMNTHAPGGRGIDILREIAMGPIGRPCFALRSGNDSPVATARGRGLFDGGFNLMLGDQPGRLDTDKKRTHLAYTGPGGSGRCGPRIGQRGIVAVLPAVLSVEQQIFIALLGAPWWIRLSDSG